MSLIQLKSGGLTRREFVGGALAASIGWSAAAAQPPPATAPPDPMCPRCGGIGRIPVQDAKPFVWLKPATLPKWESVLGEQACPICQPGVTAAALAADMTAATSAALAKNKAWEERLGWKLACAITRHAVVHTQLSPAQVKGVGLALETLTLHLQRLTGSLVLTPTRPDTLELVLLWERSSWDQFRQAMEALYTPQELGESWGTARECNAYDHFLTPHIYETPQSVRGRPITCGATFIAARRQLSAATNSQAPFWLLEGFATYGDFVVHRANRWYTVYATKQVTAGDWLAEARQLAAATRQRPWPEIIVRELRDWESEDHFQTMSMAAFLLEAQPAKFLDLVRRFNAGEDQVTALEAAYQMNLAELEQHWSRWLLSRR